MKTPGDFELSYSGDLFEVKDVDFILAQEHTLIWHFRNSKLSHCGEGVPVLSVEKAPELAEESFVARLRNSICIRAMRP